MFAFNTGSQSAKRSRAAMGNALTNSLMRGKALGGVNELVALAIGLAVVGIIAGLSILVSGTSAGLISAVAEILAFMGLIGLGIAVGIIRRLGLF